MGNDVLYDGSSLAYTRIGRVPEEHEIAERKAATRAVAGNFARSADDCEMLLDMLGLTAADGLRRPRRFVLTEGVEPDPDVVPINRPSSWANPFILGHYYLWVDRSWGHPYSERVEVPDGVEPDAPLLECCTSVEVAVAWHKAWLPRSGLPIADLVGKDVACCCRTTAPCHGDALLEAAWQLHIDRKKAKA